jgi:hypothetical protein
MDFIAKKYTVLMGNEPLVLWIKDDQVQSAKFMDKRVQLQLDSEAVRLIKDNPTKIVNGSNLTSNENFTQAVSRMMGSKLELAIAKGDKKTLSRFARSELVPENMKHTFITAINRQEGLRGVLTRAVNRTNGIFQGLAKKIDRFFDKINDRIANKKLDPYLSEYQLKYVNRAPPISYEDAKGYVAPDLMQLASDFHKSKGLDHKDVDFSRLDDKIILNEFLESAVEKGYPLKDAKIALYQVDNDSRKDAIIDFQSDRNSKIQDELFELRDKLRVYELKEASKNETIEDFKTLSKDLEPADKIDLLVKNKEYQQLSEEEKTKIEDTHIFRHEPILQRAEELQNITEAVQAAQPLVETVIERTPTLDFLDKKVQEQIGKEWTHQQAKNRANAEPTRNFMNIAAVKFNGVKKDALEKWGEQAKSHGNVGNSVIEKFINATLRNAEELVKAGIMQIAEPGNYKFVDNYAKEALYKNIDKPVSQIAEANKGKEVTREIAPKEELKERLESITSVESFQKLVMADGKIDPVALQEYTDKIVSLSAAVHTQEKANVITREDLRAEDQAHERSKSKEQTQQQAGGIER